METGRLEEGQNFAGHLVASSSPCQWLQSSLGSPHQALDGSWVVGCEFHCDGSNCSLAREWLGRIPGSFGLEDGFVAYWDWVEVEWHFGVVLGSFQAVDLELAPVAEAVAVGSTCAFPVVVVLVLADAVMVDLADVVVGDPDDAVVVAPDDAAVGVPGDVVVGDPDDAVAGVPGDAGVGVPVETAGTGVLDYGVVGVDGGPTELDLGVEIVGEGWHRVVVCGPQGQLWPVLACREDVVELAYDHVGSAVHTEGGRCHYPGKILVGEGRRRPPCAEEA
jgi:hypothetical protein